MQYKILEESIEHEGRTLYRIHDGMTKGGYIESEYNLSQEGKCWISEEAKVFGHAKVSEDAQIKHHVEVYGRAIVKGNARINGTAKVYGSATVRDYARVTHHARIYENSFVGGDCSIQNYAEVYGYASVKGYSFVAGHSKVRGHCIIQQHGSVQGKSEVFGNAIVKGEAELIDAMLYDRGHVSFGTLKKGMYEDMRQYIACSLNIYPRDGYYYLYKRVHKMREGVYFSLYDVSFLYEDGKIAEAEDPNPHHTVDCGAGLHVSTPFYWNQRETLIAVKVNEKDIIACQSGKLRVKKLEVLGEIHVE